MNKKRKTLHKNLVVLLVLIMLISTCSAAAAEVFGVSGTNLESKYNTYHDVKDFGVLKNRPVTHLKIGGKTAFCLESGCGIWDIDGKPFVPDKNLSVDYAAETVSQDNSLQSKIAYLGYYSLSNPTSRDYAFTQMMIWQTLPEQDGNGINSATGEYRSYFMDASVASDYELWKQRIKSKADSWDFQPDFDTSAKAYAVRAGEQTTLTDKAGVLADYGDFTFCGDNVTITHRRAESELTVEVSKTCTAEKILISKEMLEAVGIKKYTGVSQATYLYNSSRVQNLAIYGTASSNAFGLSLDVDTVSGKIAIEKTKAPDAASDESLPEANAEFRVYLKSAGSYEAAPPTHRDIIKTDAEGKAVTKDLPFGIYTVSQTGGAEGHIFAEDFDAEISADEHDKVYTYEIQNKTVKSKLRIIKKDAETGNVIPRAGTAYEITNLTTGKKIKGPSTDGYFMTDKDGTVKLDTPLFYGRYRIEERTAPEGYLPAEATEFFVDGSKSVLIIEQNDVPQKGKIKLRKCGESFESVKATDMAGKVVYVPIFAETDLENAVFEVRAAEDIVTADGTIRIHKGEIADVITTGADGTAETKLLYPGLYEVRETEAPCGHVLNGKIYEVELKYSETENESAADEIRVQNQRPRIRVSLEKLIEEDAEAGVYAKDIYSNIRFGLFAAEELIASDGKSIPEAALLSANTLEEKDGRYIAVFDENLPFGKYYIKELGTDERYVLDETKYPFEFCFEECENQVTEVNINGGRPIKNFLKPQEVCKTNDETKALPYFALMAGALCFAIAATLRKLKFQ